MRQRSHFGCATHRRHELVLRRLVHADDAVEHAMTAKLASETARGDLVHNLDEGRVMRAAVAPVAE